MCDPGESPDIIVGDIWGGVARYPTLGGITAYALGTDACNLGTCWANFIQISSDHPIFGQNLFRLKNGRFEQIGQSWVKHTFGADQNDTCSNSCIPAPNQSHLGVNCSDAYAPQQNGGQTMLGPKSDINPYTGAFVYPFSHINETGIFTYKRLQVHNTDVNPALNPGALYYAEVQYISPDDALGGNGANNCTYRRVTVLPGGTFGLQLVDQAHREEAAIQAWGDVDPTVLESVAGVAADGIFRIASKATFLGQDRWHYEYAVQNINVTRGANSFSVTIPAGTTITNIGFHDVDYHSGEIYDNVNWTASQASGAVVWKVATSDEATANNLRWGTLYNFRFDADVPPGTQSVTLSLPNPPPGQTPSPGTTSSGMALVPSRCDHDGICDTGESCASCPEDCANQHGGGGCCGNALCEAGEDAAACFADCGTAAAAETACGDGVDDDRDGLLDCMDPDCCTSVSCAPLDSDGDAFGACDCNNADPSVWSTPAEIAGLHVTKGGGTTLSWSPATGGTQATYDVLRAPDPSDFQHTATCLGSTAPSLVDNTSPAAGGALAYLVRAKNAGPNGVGTLGTDSAGHERTTPSCP